MKYLTNWKVLLATILLISLFFRTYQIVERYQFDHDNDLSAWIVRDIAVNHHFRLIGQLTSAPGIYIGPLFYYLLVPFFMLTNMDPIGALIPITILGVFTTFMYYLVFSKLFNRTVGLMAAFLQATLIDSVNFDRWVVPSTLTNLWTISYFYTILMITRGRYRYLFALGILVGLIWDVHIALLPTLLAIPVAMIVTKKLPPLKQVLIGLASFLIVSIPLIVFEFKHHFIQTISFIQNFSQNHGGGTGLEKLNLITLKLVSTLASYFLAPQSLPEIVNRILILILGLSGIWLAKSKLIKKSEVIVLYTWLFGVIMFFTISSTLISEYYFANIEIIFLVFLVILFYQIYHKSRLGKVLILAILSLVLIKNVYYFTTVQLYLKGYNERSNALKFIKADATTQGFPCFALSYITSPGENVGFRYFSWLDNLKLINPNAGGPVYTIVIPNELVTDRSETRFGHIGVVLPNLPGQDLSPEHLSQVCSAPNYNEVQPVLGFTN